MSTPLLNGKTIIKKKFKRQGTVTEEKTIQRTRHSLYHEKYLGSEIEDNKSKEPVLSLDAGDNNNSKADLEKYNFDIDIRKLSEEIWQKKRCIKGPYDVLPIPKKVVVRLADDVRLSPNIPVLQKRKEELNATKSVLDPYPLNEWHKHTRIMNTAGNVMRTVRTEIAPEYCSQAWCKMFECLSSFHVIPKIVTDAASQPNCDSCIPFYSVHLCEAPGAFISATNHYLRTNFPNIKWDWLATTLNPYYEGNDVGSMINEDKLILSSMNNWTFLEDGTGNIMDEKNLNRLISDVRTKFSKADDGNFPHIGLVTADGSIDCQTNPMEQEITVSPLHFAEIVAALHILGRGGSFILKIFTFLECHAINHLYILSALFGEVHLYKPATSKEGNSEVYVICLNYIGMEYCDHFVGQLRELIGRGGLGAVMSNKGCLISPKLVNGGFKGSSTENFRDKIIDAAMFFTGYQIAIIKRNIKSFSGANDSERELIYYQHAILRTEVAENWILKYNVKTLSPQFGLFRIRNYKKQVTHVDPRGEVGCFLDKVNRRNADAWTKLNEIQNQLSLYHGFEFGNWSITEIKGNAKNVLLSSGLRYTNIRSSRFCFGRLLQERNEVREAVQPFRDSIKVHPNRHYSCCGSLQSHFKNWLPKAYFEREEHKLHSICFRESAYDLIHRTDIATTRANLKKILLEITDLKQNQSLFLCRFPLLSRLHLGFIYVISTFFEAALVCAGGRNFPYPQGILLYRYKAIEDMNQFNMITDIIKALKSTTQTTMTLEIIPVSILTQLENFNEIMRYNLSIVSEHLEEIITEIKQFLPQPHQIVPQHPILQLIQNGQSQSKQLYDDGNEIDDDDEFF